MIRPLLNALVLLALGWAGPALAEVRIHFHSFNGSVLVGRYPHTFIVLEGTLDETGERISENYGFSARSASPAVLAGPVEHMVLAEKERNIARTNRHFSITLTDAQYRRIVAEVRAWQNAPGKFYDLDTRNCIHFVGRMAELLGLKVEYPEDMLRRPKKWLNHVTALNPQLGARLID
jgi:hypothetical protein